MISHPASLSCLLYCVFCRLLSHCSCILLVPQLIRSLPSVEQICCRPVSLQLHRGWKFPVSQDPDSASARRPSGSTLAPSSLVSTVAHQSTSSTRLPRPSGSTLVGHQPALSSGLHSSDFTSSLVPLAPLGSSLPLTPLRPSGSPPEPRSPEPSALPWPSGSSPSPWPCGTPSPPWAPLPPAPQLSVTSWCRQPLLHHGSSFRPLHRGLPSWLLSGSYLTPAPSTVCTSLVSSVSSLAPSTVISTLDSVSRPPAGCLSSS